MAHFVYKGRDAGGKLVEGVLEGPSAGSVADLLLGRGVTPVSIEESKVKGDEGAATFSFFRQQVGHVDILLFSRQIHTLLKAGVPIMRALGGLQESATNPAMKDVIRDVRDSLEAGRELSVSLARHPKVFSPFYISMVRVGEATGLLDEIFLRLFDHLEFERYMREQVKSALRYPMFVVIAMAVAIVVVNIFVIPAFAKVFEGFGAQLPLMTKILLGFSNFMVAWWPVMLVGIIAAVLLFRTWVGTRAGRMQWEAIALRFPIAGKIVRKAAMARFARSFALSTRRGVPVMQALTNSAQTVDNSYIARKIEGTRDNGARGESVLRSAIASGFCTPVVLQMIAVGEESGALDDMLEEVGQMYQREVDYELKTLGQQIEPILIVSLGVLVLILALGIFLPMWALGKVAIKR